MGYPVGTKVVTNKQRGKVLASRSVDKHELYLVQLTKGELILALKDEIKLQKEPKRFPIPVEIYSGGGIGCKADDCQQERECANHFTAGDFRSEDGMTPDLAVTTDAWYCTKKDSGVNDGCLIFKDGKIIIAPNPWRGF